MDLGLALIYLGLALFSCLVIAAVLQLFAIRRALDELVAQGRGIYREAAADTAPSQIQTLKLSATD